MTSNSSKNCPSKTKNVLAKGPRVYRYPTEKETELISRGSYLQMTWLFNHRSPCWEQSLYEDVLVTVKTRRRTKSLILSFIIKMVCIMFRVPGCTGVPASLTFLLTCHSCCPKIALVCPSQFYIRHTICGQSSGSVSRGKQVSSGRQRSQASSKVWKLG